jgi:hypothetical protein
MTQATASTTKASTEESRSKRVVATSLRLFALALAIAALILAAAMLPGWVRALPRAVLRGMTEAVLRAVLVVYIALVLGALAAFPLFVWRAVRSRRPAPTSRRVLRALAASLACLLSLIGLELGAAVWRTWMHRFPALPTTFEAKPRDEYRIVVLGGSSALGEPYCPWLSVGQIVAWQLQQAIPERRFECEILAWLGDSLEKQHHKLAGLKHRPDAVIIYSGHNEFAARFEEQRDPWLDEEPRVWLAREAYRATLASPFCRLAYELISKNRLDTPPPLTGRHQLIDPPLCSPSEAADILADFRARMEAIVVYCERIDAVPILIVPPANEAGFEPSRSTLPPSVPQAQRRRLVGDFSQARAAELTEPARAAAGYAAILGQHPGFAEAHFRLARLLEREGRPGEAGPHYLQALENDGLPVRCKASFRAVYEEVARRHPRAIFIDGRRELAAISPSGLLGHRVIQDTHHPTLFGYVGLATAVLRELQLLKTIDRSRPIPLPLDAIACAEHFGMDADKWATMCERTSVHYERVAGYRYDPAERLHRSRRYAEAARRIRSGTPSSLVLESLYE